MGHLGTNLYLDLGVAAGEDWGTHPPGLEFWEGRPLRNRDFLDFFSENSEIIIFSNICKIK